MREKSRFENESISPLTSGFLLAFFWVNMNPVNQGDLRRPRFELAAAGLLKRSISRPKRSYIEKVRSEVLTELEDNLYFRCRQAFRKIMSNCDNINELQGYLAKKIPILQRLNLSLKPLVNPDHADFSYELKSQIEEISGFPSIVINSHNTRTNQTLCLIKILPCQMYCWTPEGAIITTDIYSDGARFSLNKALNLLATKFGIFLD